MLGQLTPQEIEQHSTVLGWIYVVSNAVFLAIGLFLFVLLSGIGLVVGDAAGTFILGFLAMALAALMMLLGLPGMLAGYGLLKRRPWGRVLALVVGILGLANVPIGTLIGLYTLWVLLQEQASVVFRTPQQPSAVPPVY